MEKKGTAVFLFPNLFATTFHQNSNVNLFSCRSSSVVVSRFSHFPVGTLTTGMVVCTLGSSSIDFLLDVDGN